ncbi:hypothetical protein TNIN_361231 [Trichonephila inaurata madagascariensis]|uniref:Uncharacterized protein n=1 Tax=Trichonephila inaurata madagascariensis TaxID=2747483 RepID=A0A8X6X7M0_9ARAC|nr:hypothetical protein TNIN_361231 [Trichonephila inaurata madagascariensis]
MNRPIKSHLLLLKRFKTSLVFTESNYSLNETLIPTNKKQMSCVRNLINQKKIFPSRYHTHIDLKYRTTADPISKELSSLTPALFAGVKPKQRETRNFIPCHQLTSTAKI